MDNEILHGSIWKSILQFFFPILLGTFFQQLYNTVDAAVVGHFASSTALSAVGGSSAQIINLVVGFFGGLSAGCTVMISRYLGAGDRKNLSEALHTTYAFCIVGGLVCGVLGVILAPNVLELMNTPQEIMGQSETYVRVYFAGMVFIFLYNMGAGILRALGDSKRPLYYLIVCTVINIILDLLFVVVFRLDVLGVAVATLIAQAVSALLITECLMNRKPQVKLELRKIRINPKILGTMLKIGLPSGIQSSTYSISNSVIQTAINTFGVAVISGWTAQSKTDNIFWMINGSFGLAAMTFVGQNYGAGYMDRVRKGTRTCLCMALVSAAIVSSLLYFCGKYVLWIFSTDAEVISWGTRMIHLIVPGYIIYVFVEIFSSSLKARGDAIVSSAINIIGIVVFRCFWVWLFRGTDNLDQILYCYPISWAICAVILTVYYLYKLKEFRPLEGKNLSKQDTEMK